MGLGVGGSFMGRGRGGGRRNSGKRRWIRCGEGDVGIWSWRCWDVLS